jgi:hypothetical protein
MIVSRRQLVSKAALLAFAPYAVWAPLASAQSPQGQLGDLSNGVQSFPNVTNAWGVDNISVHPMEISSGNFIRVFVPKGAIDPGTMKNRRLPRGGAGFKSVVFPVGVDRATLSYWVRFPVDFDFVRGGKLPGLFGGKGNSGGKIPDGTDGFSFRLMWGEGGRGQVYAYLPSSIKYGSRLFAHKFHFKTGQWHQIKQEVILNTPGESDGIVRMWVDSQYIGEERGVVMRTVDTLHINGMFFDVFFGGNDDSWAPKTDTHIDFSNFQLTS